MPAQKFSYNDVRSWYQSQEGQIFLGDAIGNDEGSPMTVGFARYGKGAHNNWTVMYDEVLIITKGTFSVKTAEGIQTAKPGEGIFLQKGTKLTYYADEAAELVYISYPHWAEAQAKSPFAHLMDTFHEVPARKALCHVGPHQAPTSARTRSQG